MFGSSCLASRRFQAIHVAHAYRCHCSLPCVEVLMIIRKVYVLLSSGVHLQRGAPHTGEAPEWPSNGIGGARRVSAGRAMTVRRGGGGVAIAKGHPPADVLHPHRSLAHGRPARVEYNRALRGDFTARPSRVVMNASPYRSIYSKRLCRRERLCDEAAAMLGWMSSTRLNNNNNDSNALRLSLCNNDVVPSSHTFIPIEPTMR